MKINDATIKECLDQSAEPGEALPICCVGVVLPSVAQTLLLGAATSAATTFFLLGFTDKKIALIRLDNMGQPAESAVLDYKDITSVKISNFMFGIGKAIEISIINKTKLHLKINKIVIGAKLTKQKENLISICELLENKFN